MAAGKEKLIGVQYLRAIAALMVAYFHLQDEIPAFSRALSFDRIVDSHNLSCGVSVFFVISGFIMYVTSRKLSASEFAKRRLVRIIPLYWGVTLLVVAVALLDPRGLQSTVLDATYITKSLIFVPYHNPGQHGALFPVLVPGWTLNYEMAFYTLFALALLAPARWRMVVIGSTLGIAALAGCMHSRPMMTSLWGFYTSSLLLLFAAGIGLGMLYTKLRPIGTSSFTVGSPWSGPDGKFFIEMLDGSRRLVRFRHGSAVVVDARPQLPRWVCGLIVGIGLWLILADWSGAALANTMQSLGAIAIVAGVVAWEWQYGLSRVRWLLLLGDASYSIYLVHLFAFGLVRQAWKHVHLHGDVGALVFVVVAMGAALGLALVTYRVIERPSMAFLNRTKKQAQVAVTA